MHNKSHISYEQLLLIVNWGIFSMKIKNQSICDKRLNKCTPVEGAIHNGIYVGSPGKDIYYMLPYLRDNQMIEVATKIIVNFPSYPPKTNVNVAACIRFIYGQFEKQGTLKSKKSIKIMKKKKPDWRLSRIFLKLLYKEFKKYDNYYGLTILCEMEGHRLGDEAVINKDEKKLMEMKKKYLESVKYAHKCKSYKHLFSIYYWAAQYFIKFGNIKKAIKYFKMSILNAEKYYYKYFSNGEQYYSKRFVNSLVYFEKKDKQKYKNIINRYVCKK